MHFLLLLLLRCRRRRRVDLHQVIPLLLSSPLPPSPLVLPLLLLLSLCLTPPVTPFTELDPNWIMVWFQCESCGENLKKPKLQGHFRGCAARKVLLFLPSSLMQPGTSFQCPLIIYEIVAQHLQSHLISSWNLFSPAYILFCS